MEVLKKWFSSNYLLLIILGIALSMRLYHLEYQSVWLDEITSITEANPELAWSDLELTIVTSDPHPQLYFILLKCLFLMFGYTIYVARMFSAILGVLGVFSIYLLGKEIKNKKVGLIAAFLLAINAFHLYYSQEVRMYGLLMLFTVLSFYRLVIFLKKSTYINAIGYGVFTGLMLFTQFFGLFVLMSQMLILLIIWIRKEQSEKIAFFVKSLLSVVIMIMFFLPAINIFIATTKKKYAVMQPITIDLVQQIFKDFADNSNLVLWLSIIIICFYLFKFIKLKKHQTQEGTILFILLTWIVITLAIPIIRSILVTPMIVSRYFIVILPAIILIIALGIERMNKKIFQVTTLSMLTFLIVFQLTYKNDYYFKINKGQFREVADFVIKENVDKEPVYSNLSWYLIYLFNRNKTKTPLVEIKIEDYVQELMKNPNSIKAFWYFGAFGYPFQLSPEAEKFMNEHFDMVHSLEKFDTWTRHYVPKEVNIQGEISSVGLLLSNFTDINWKKGVGRHNSQLLFDVNPKNEEIIKEGLQLKTKSGKNYTIIKLEKIGNYFNAHVDKDPTVTIDDLQYPNTIRFYK